MNYGAKFDADLRYGEARENAFVHALLRSRVEHKRDRKCMDTGNLAVEYQQRFDDGNIRASGISITQADRWAFEFRPEWWLLVPTEGVEGLARRAIREGRHRWIGDGDNHHNALVPIDWFVETGAQAFGLREAA